MNRENLHEREFRGSTRLTLSLWIVIALGLFGLGAAIGWAGIAIWGGG